MPRSVERHKPQEEAGRPQEWRQQQHGRAAPTSDGRGGEPGSERCSPGAASSLLEQSPGPHPTPELARLLAPGLAPEPGLSQPWSHPSVAGTADRTRGGAATDGSPGPGTAR
eukprot:scaffold37858_cov60-Phaeocystis_antarctica.AAC.1